MSKAKSAAVFWLALQAYGFSNGKESLDARRDCLKAEGTGWSLLAEMFGKREADRLREAGIALAKVHNFADMTDEEQASWLADWQKTHGK